VDIAREPIWIEAPHIFKRNGWYYLTAAEGGTGPEHSQVIFRARSLDEPFEPYAGNPILTQRDLPEGRANPITSAGHADFVQLPNGDWWAVFLATRAYDQHYYNTGRETFMLPVTWSDDWPLILEPRTEIPYRHARPQLPVWDKALVPTTGNFTWRDNFEADSLAPQWSLLRRSDTSWYQLSDGRLSLTPQSLTLADRAQPSFVARRQAHMTFAASTQMGLPFAEGISAGLAAFQNETHHYYMGLQRRGEGYRLFIEKANGEAAEVIHSTELGTADAEYIVLSVSGERGVISFHYQLPGQASLQPVALALDAKVLSTAVAGGFVGAHIGIHARKEEP
jgi:alpha-N-arabinofuranosidase